MRLIDYRFWEADLKEATSLFDCGNKDINDFLKDAVSNSATDAKERLLLVVENEQILGFIVLSLREMRTSFLEKKNYSILVVEALGIDLEHQYKGLGRDLLFTAYKLALTVNQAIPIEGVYLIALSDALEFYEKFDLKNLNAPPHMVPLQKEFQMIINIDQILSLGILPFEDPLHLK